MAIIKHEISTVRSRLAQSRRASRRQSAERRNAMMQSTISSPSRTIGQPVVLLP